MTPTVTEAAEAARQTETDTRRAAIAVEAASTNVHLAERAWRASEPWRNEAANLVARLLGPDVEAPADQWRSTDSSNLYLFDAGESLEFGVWNHGRPGRGRSPQLGVRRMVVDGPERPFVKITSLAHLGAWLATNPTPAKPETDPTRGEDAR